MNQGQRLSEPTQSIPAGPGNGAAAPDRQKSLSTKTWLLLVGICLAVYFLNLAGDRVLTSHEMDPGGGARQMISEGDWLIPRIGDHTWLEKPPLLHWLVASAILVTESTSEWIVRLPSAVAGTGVVLLVALIVGRWKGDKAGLVAGIVQCTSHYMITYSLLGEADMLLALIVVAAIAVFIHLHGIGLPQPSRRPKLWACVFWSLLGLSNLVKGPMFGAAIVLLPCLAWLSWQCDRSAWRRLWSPAGITLAILIATPWPILTLIKEPSAFDLWMAHTIGRARGDSGIGDPWWYYLRKVPDQLLPWTIITLIALVPALKKLWRNANSAERFSLLWALTPLIALSLSSGKHHHYAISCLPGFTLVTTNGILALEKRILGRNRYATWGAWSCVGFFAPLFLIGGLGAGFYLPEYRLDAWLLGLVCGLGALATGRFALSRRPGRAFGAFVLTIVLAVAQVYLHVIPALDTRREDREFLANVDEHLPPDTVLFTTGGPKIVRDIFYVQVPLSGIWQPEDIGKFLGSEQTFYVIGRRRIEEQLQQFGTVEIASQSKFSHKEKSLADRYTLFRVQRTGY